MSLHTLLHMQYVYTYKTIYNMYMQTINPGEEGADTCDDEQVLSA